MMQIQYEKIYYCPYCGEEIKFDGDWCHVHVRVFNKKDGGRVVFLKVDQNQLKEIVNQIIEEQLEKKFEEMLYKKEILDEYKKLPKI